MTYSDVDIIESLHINDLAKQRICIVAPPGASAVCQSPRRQFETKCPSWSSTRMFQPSLTFPLLPNVSMPEFDFDKGLVGKKLRIGLGQGLSS